MNTFSCERCGYETKHKHCLLAHYQRKKHCVSITIIDKPINTLIDSLVTKNELGLHQCNYCERRFNNRSNMLKHKKICKQKPDEVNQQILKMQQQIKKQQEQIEAIKQQPLGNDKINLELQYYKNRKNEKFYQLLLENYLGGTHKTLSCGITDVTTDTRHAEIKEWSSWKEAVGQLTCYNIADPKEKLDIYVFGKYAQKCKDEAIKIVISCKIDIYEFVDTDEGVSIISLKNNEEIYKYKPE